MERAIASAFAGNAGEFFALAELTRRGWTAALTARNNRAYDILAKRDDEFAAIRVKTKTPLSDAFQWNAKANGEIFLELTNKGDFCVLVDVSEDTNVGPTYYIVPTPLIDKWLKDDFHTWVTTPGAKGQQRAKDNTRRIVHLDGDATKVSCGYRQRLAIYKGAWETLARGEYAIEQLSLLGQQAGMSVDSLLDLAKSGMNGQQLVDYLMDLRERTNAKIRA
jgi:hypothetical protein